MTSYAANTLASSIMTVCTGTVGLVNLVAAARRFHEFRMQPAHAASKKAPLHIHLTFLFSNVFAAIMIALCMTGTWLWSGEVNEYGDVVDIAPFCTATCKAACGAYAASKMGTYLFYFLKQRAVRPLSQPSLLEKLAFLATTGIAGFAALAAAFSEGDANRLDGTCQVELPIWMITFMAGADASLSSVYLYLFIQPLRATISANQNVRRAFSQPEGATREKTAPAPNMALEAVMKKNTYSYILTVTMSLCSMMFMLGSHLRDDHYSRKWITTVGSVDMLISSLALRHVMAKSAAATAPATAPTASHTTPEVEPTRNTSGKIGGGGAGSVDRSGAVTETSALQLHVALTNSPPPRKDTFLTSPPQSTTEPSPHRLLSAVSSAEPVIQIRSPSLCAVEPSRRSVAALYLASASAGSSSRIPDADAS